MSTTKTDVHIDIVSDVMCPWCFIGQQNLAAAAKLVDTVNLTVSWRPYQLDATIPPQGRDRREYLNAKFGGEEKAAAIYARVSEAGKAAGIDFDFHAIEVSPNTLDAHRVIRWAANAGGNVQDRLVKALFALYFTKGVNIGDHAVLAKTAGEAGMDETLVLGLLASDADKDAVLAEIDHARQMGVTGVPCFIIDGKHALTGAQPPQVLAQALR